MNVTIPTKQGKDNNANLIKVLKAMKSERKAKAISLVELILLLADVAEGNYTKGYLIMASEPSGMRKTGNPFFDENKECRVKKLTGWGFDTNADYTRKVNLQREREGKAADFEALPTYAEKVNNVVYRHKKETHKLYMSVFPTPNFGQFTEWLVDGRAATAEEIAQIKTFLPESKEGSNRQELDKKINIKRPLLSNIFLISLKGKRYFVKDNVLLLQD